MAANQLKVGALLSYIGLAINIIVGLLYTPWMINSIGKADYGLYTLALSVIHLFVFDFGIGQAVTRFVAKYLAEGNQERANNCLGLVYKLYFCIDIVVFIALTCLYFFIPQIYQELSADEIEKFKIIYVAVAFFSVISFPFIPVNGVLTANEKFIQLKLCDLAHKLIIVISMTACLLAGFGLYALVWVNIIAGILTIALKLFFIKRDTNTSINFSYKDKKEFREILGFSGWVTVKSLSERMIFTLSPTILGMVAGSVEIALFGICNVIEGYVYSFAGALNGLFLPKVSKIAANDNGDIMPLMVRVGRILFFITGLIIIGFIAVGQDFIKVWLGDGYEGVYLSTVLIILPSLFYVPQEIGCTAIAVHNKVKYQSIVYLVMGLSNAIMGYFLAKSYGCFGLCAAIFIAYNIRNVGLEIIFKEQLHLHLGIFFKDVFFKMGIPLILAGIIGYGCHFIPLSGWIGFITKGSIVVFFYIMLMWLLALSSDEKNFFIQQFKK